MKLINVNIRCRFWCQEFEEELSEIIASLLTSKYQNSSPNKRKRTLKNSSTQNTLPTSEQVSIASHHHPRVFRLNSKLNVIVFNRQLLCHLEHFRRSCRHGNGTGTGLYVQDPMQRALQQAFSHSSDSTKVSMRPAILLHFAYLFTSLIGRCRSCYFQKQYTDLFALAAEDETSGVGRRGTSGRGRKPPPNKKDTNNTNSNNKKNSEPINSVFSSDDESSEVINAIHGHGH